MATYILVDFMNLAFRAKYTAAKHPVKSQISVSMSIVLNSITKVRTMFNADHAVLCFEGRSWRKDVYPEYKANRIMTKLKKSPKEIEDDAIFFEGMNHFIEYFDTKANTINLRCPCGEADDMIVTWIDTHPDDKHIIISTDTDFYQLLSDNVSMYNGVTENYITLNSITYRDKPVIDTKTKKEKVPPDPKYALFEKCIRGDTSDNIRPAYPGIRLKSSKSKVGLIEAYEDSTNQGYAWNNFMQQRWVDHEDTEHTVYDRYMFNKLLIDLRCQPDDMKAEFKKAIDKAITKPVVPQAGVHFIQFCGKWDLFNIKADAPSYDIIYGRPYIPKE